MLLIGHRGIYGLAPANTITGFQKAIDHDLDMIEMDLRIWQGEIFIIHDPITANPHPHIPTMRETLDFIAGRTSIYLDIKDSAVIEPLCKLLQEYLAQGPWKPEQIYIASYNHYDLLAVNDMLPEINRGALLAATPVGTSAVIKASSANFVVLDIRNLNDKMVRDCYSEGIKIFVYTIKNERDYYYCLQHQCIGGVVLDYPPELFPKNEKT